jgi:hypothetical protein
LLLATLFAGLRAAAVLFALISLPASLSLTGLAAMAFLSLGLVAVAVLLISLTLIFLIASLPLVVLIPLTALTLRASVVSHGCSFWRRGHTQTTPLRRTALMSSRMSDRYDATAGTAVAPFSF